MSFAAPAILLAFSVSDLPAVNALLNAAATVLLAGGIAALSDNVAVPDARQCGIGAAMTVAALEVAQAVGCEIAFVQPPSMGGRLYERLGFRTIKTFAAGVWTA